MDILECKTIIMNEINNLFKVYQSQLEENTAKEKEWMKEKETIHQANHRLIEEVAEKDKLLFHNEKKFLDYELMINKIQDEALKEMDHKTKHDMLRAQDKEIFDRDEEIKRLQRKINTLEEEKKLVTDTVKEVVKDVDELKDELKDEVEEKKTLVERMKDSTIEDKETGEVNPNIIYEEEEEEEDDEVKEEGKEDDEVEEEVKDEVKEEEEEDDEVEEEEEKEEVKGEEEETESEDEGVVVETIKHYGKEYFIIEGEEPIQYIYAIEDGDLGEKKGEMKDGKKKMYKK